MAKLTKKAEILDTLHGLMRKEAAQAQTDISGEPCKDTKVTSVSDSAETTDKNSVGPDKLNKEQGYEQKPASDPSEPLASAKSASASLEVEKLAGEVLAMINSTLSKSALAQTDISGVPCKDTKVTSVSDATEKTDKNKVGPDKLNKEQDYEQKPSTDSSKPLANAKSAEEMTAKVASYDFGVKFCETLMNKVAAVKATQSKQAEAEMLKEAGRRDFDTLIAQAAQELEYTNAQAAEQEKQAEFEGAAAFDNLYKQAQAEQAAEEVKALKAKLAEYQQIEQYVKVENEKRAAAEYEASLAEKIAGIVIGTLKRESATAPVK